MFNYASKAHTVTEVSKGDYASCSGRSPLSNEDSGLTTVTLATPGTHYYICNIPGHCASGMKLAVTVAGGGSGGSSLGGATPYAVAAGGALVPPMSAVVAAAAGALINVVQF